MFDFFQKIKHYPTTHFYIAQRKRIKVLLENDRPLGGNRVSIQRIEKEY